MIPLNQRHLRMTLRPWVTHYNKGRPHSSLGPGIPEKPWNSPLTGPKTTGTGCHEIVRSGRRTLWAVYITNTGWNSASLELKEVF
jgi:Integrase core domain